MRYYIDTEFDGHNGPLLSLAIVSENDFSAHFRVSNRALDPWVAENVEPLMDQHDADIFADDLRPSALGERIADFIGGDQHPVIIADSPVDIARFCQALSTGPDGGWRSVDYPMMTFEVHDVAAYPTDLPGAVQHNAWWDAKALRYRLMLEHCTA